MTQHQHHRAEHDAHGARFDETTQTVLIEALAIGDADVVREARRWTRGERGVVVDDPEALRAADLTAFVVEAVRIGAHALSVTGTAQEAKALERMLKDVGDKTAETTSSAMETTQRFVKDASEAVGRAAEDAKKAITEADAQNRKEFTAAVVTAKQDLNTEVQRIFGGESPELLERLRPLLEKFGTGLSDMVRESSGELLTKVARQFDPADPTSPMAKHAAELNARHEKLTQQVEKQHTELADRISELTAVLKLEEAKTSLAKVTPIKGGSYEDQVHALMHDIAAGLGDEYAATGTTVGQLARCKKGDGVLSVTGGSTKVVLEMTDSHRTSWSDYLEEAERNRVATASLGLVRTIEQNGGQSIRTLGARRIVMAFDPEHDQAELLRTVVMLLRLSALTVSARTGATEIETAEEKIGEALDQLDRIDEVKKSAGLITKHAEKIDSQADAINTAICRLLDQALEALAGSEAMPRRSAENLEVGGAA
jgi:hypothetical protein